MSLSNWSFKNRVLFTLASFVFVMIGYGVYAVSALKSVGSNPSQAAQLADSYTTIFIVITFLASVVILALGWMIYNHFTSSLNHFTQNISRGVNHLEKSSKQIATAGSVLATSTHEQSVALQQTASALVEVNAMIAKNSDGSAKTDEVVRKSQDTAVRGKQQVYELMKSIEGINSSQDEILHEIEGSNHRISEIVKLISEIGEKTKVINEIVFQTKILSFNASVEAARAGEHGKGFAVVAQEVGNLAQMSGVAAEEISNMLTDSIQKVEDIISGTTSKVNSLISGGRSKIKEGTDLAKSCNAILEEVVNDINAAQIIMNEISLASKEQSQGISEINKAIHELDKATNQNAQAAHTTSTGSEGLYVQAAELKGVTEDMHKFIYGSSFKEDISFVKTVKPTKAKVEFKTETKTESSKSVDSKKQREEKFNQLVEKMTSGKAPENKEPAAPVKANEKKVVPIEQAKSNKKVAPVAAKKPGGPVKKVVAGTDIPLETDPRFEDV